MSAKNIYLITYNAAMLGGWSTVFAAIVRTLLSKRGTNSCSAAHSAYTAARPVLLVCQTAATLEVFHALLKLVPTPVATTAAQTLTKLWVLRGVVELGGATVSGSSWCLQMITAWSASEMIRYAFYLAQLTAKDKTRVPMLLTWLRYSAFIALYPIGISGEMGCVYKAIDVVKKSGAGSVRLPNRANFAFDYPTFLKAALMLAYPCGTYVLMGHMFKLRKRAMKIQK